MKKPTRESTTPAPTRPGIQALKKREEFLCSNDLS
jgi:hypothetical protein